MATIKDVAKVAGVSVATVSRVLNNTAPVNLQTRKKVERVIKELNYQPSMIAKGMRSQRSKIFAVLVPVTTNPYHIRLFEHIEQEAKKFGYHIILASMDESEMSEYDSIMEMMSRSVDGIILCTYQGDQEGIGNIISLSQELPIVFMDNFPFNEDINAVYIDGYEGMEQIVEHIISLGHRRIGYIDRVTDYQVANERYTSYVKTLEKHGIPFNEDLIYGGNYEINSGYKAAKYFMEKATITPTAIVASNDAMGVGAIGYLRENGYKVPADIAVAGFDDIYISKLVDPPLTTFRQPLDVIAGKSVRLLIDKIENPKLANRKIVVKGDLVIRSSTTGQNRDKIFPI